MRTLKANDLPELERILIETAAFTSEEVACARELLEEVLNNPQQTDYQVTVATEEGHPCGYILYGPIPLTEGAFDVYWIAVDPAMQGQGTGRRLLAYAEAQLQLQGVRMLCVETSSQESYGRTRSFYERAGYTEECRIRDFYRPGDDRITYVKRFTSPKEQ